jgi:hypothetical protein
MLSDAAQFRKADYGARSLPVAIMTWKFKSGDWKEIRL